MRVKFPAAVLAAALSISLLGVSGASAATEFGDNCVADEAAKNPLAGTVFALSAPNNPLSLTAPSSGVVTRWKINQAVSPSPFPLALKVLRQTSPLSVQFIGESAQTVNPGVNVFETRIPVQAGDRLGLFGVGNPGLVLCRTPASPSRIGVVEGPSSVGSNAIVNEFESEVRIPAAAIVEPDADNDGFGDETQDKCPQSAAAQVACLAVQLSTSVTKGKKAVTIAITGTSAANVTVDGKAPLGKGKKAKLKGGTKAVAPGTFTKFRLKFPAKLTKRLEELSPSKKLTLKVTISAPNVGTAPTQKVIKVKLKGRGPKA